MKNISFVLVIVLALSVMSIINAHETKQRPKNRFRERLLDLLTEVKRRELLLNIYKQPKEEFQRREDKPLDRETDEDNYPRTYLRRKVVGISDNPF